MNSETVALPPRRADRFRQSFPRTEADPNEDAHESLDWFEGQQWLEQPVTDRGQQLIATSEMVMDRHALDAQLRSQATHAECTWAI